MYRFNPRGGADALPISFTFRPSARPSGERRAFRHILTVTFPRYIRNMGEFWFHIAVIGGGIVSTAFVIAVLIL